MATITPNSDQKQTRDCTIFQVGDMVRSKIDARVGQIINPTGLNGVQPLPQATPAMPTTVRVDVSWVDGTVSTVLLTTLSRL